MYSEKYRKYWEMTIPCSSSHCYKVGNEYDCTLQYGDKVTVKQIFANCSVCTALVSLSGASLICTDL